MNFQSAGEIFDRVRRFYQERMDWYEDAAECVENQRCKMLIDYMRTQESVWETAMRRYEDQVKVAVAKTFLQYAPSEEFMNRFKELPEKKVTFDELRDRILGFDDELIKMFEGAARIATAPEVKNAFDNLKKAAEERKKLVGRAMGSAEFDM